MSSAKRLRALTHPLRWRLIDLVGAEGTATATRCAQILGESVASCSYHLGILEKYNYLERVPDASGREKPWREVRGGQDLSAPGPELEDQMASEAAVEAFLDFELERMKLRHQMRSSETVEWAELSTLAGSDMWVTAAELTEIRRRLLDLQDSYRDRTDDVASRPAGARLARVFFSTSIRPDL